MLVVVSLLLFLFVFCNRASGGRRGCMHVVYITRMVLVPGNCALGGRRGCMLVVYITRMVLVPGSYALGGRRGCMLVVYITRMVLVWLGWPSGLDWTGLIQQPRGTLMLISVHVAGLRRLSPTPTPTPFTTREWNSRVEGG